MRKLRMRYAQTEMRKKVNRMSFGKITEEYGNSFKDFGMLSQDNSGMIRVGVRSEQGMKIKSRKRNRKAGLSTEEGNTSVYAITPIEGLILPPVKNIKDEEDVRDDYFSSNKTFRTKEEEEGLDNEMGPPPTKKRKTNNM